MVKQRPTYCNFIKTRSMAVDLNKHGPLGCLETVAAGDKYLGLAFSTIIEDDTREVCLSLYTRNFRHRGTLEHNDSISNYYKFLVKVIEIDRIPPLLISISCGMSIYTLISGKLACMLSTYNCLDFRLPFLTSIKSCSVCNDGKRMIMAGSREGYGTTITRRLHITKIIIFML